MGYTSLDGNIRKSERKFYVIKPDSLENDLIKIILSDKINDTEQYHIEQFYDEQGIKYRHIRTLDRHFYTKHTKLNDSTSKKLVNIEQLTECEFTAAKDTACTDIISKIRSSVYLTEHKMYLTVDRFKHPYTGLTLIELWNVDEKADIFDYDMNFKSLVEVTNNKFFTNRNIAQNGLSEKLIVLEGTDFVGKTSLAKLLVKDGYRVSDRDMENYSNNILMDRSLTDIIKSIEALGVMEDRFYITLTNSDTSEIDRRKVNREATERLSDFDFDANTYNLLYKAPLTYLKEHNRLPKNVTEIACEELNLEQIYEIAINKIQEYTG